MKLHICEQVPNSTGPLERSIHVLRFQNVSQDRREHVPSVLTWLRAFFLIFSCVLWLLWRSWLWQAWGWEMWLSWQNWCRIIVAIFVIVKFYGAPASSSCVGRAAWRDQIVAVVVVFAVFLSQFVSCSSAWRLSSLSVCRCDRNRRGGKVGQVVGVAVETLLLAAIVRNRCLVMGSLPCNRPVVVVDRRVVHLWTVNRTQCTSIEFSFFYNFLFLPVLTRNHISVTPFSVPQLLLAHPEILVP